MLLSFKTCQHLDFSHHLFRSDYCQQCWETFDPKVFFNILLSSSSWLQNSKEVNCRPGHNMLSLKTLTEPPPSSSLFDLIFTSFSIFIPKHVVIAENWEKTLSPLLILSFQFWGERIPITANKSWRKNVIQWLYFKWKQSKLYSNQNRFQLSKRAVYLRQSPKGGPLATLAGRGQLEGEPKKARGQRQGSNSSHPSHLLLILRQYWLHL